MNRAALKNDIALKLKNNAPNKEITAAILRAVLNNLVDELALLEELETTGPGELLVDYYQNLASISNKTDGMRVFVKNAFKDAPNTGAGDPTVLQNNTFASYKYFQSSNTWLKTGEQESLDVDFALFVKTVNGQVPDASGNVNVTTGSSNPALGGELSGTASNATLSNSAVIVKVLTGLGSLSGAIAATDNLVQAFSKVVNFISNIATTVRGVVLSGVDVNLPGIVDTNTTAEGAFGKLQRQATANTTEARTDYIKADFSGIASTARIPFERKFQATASPTSYRLATITYKINQGADITTIAALNSAITALGTSTFELWIIITYSGSNTDGNLSLPILYS